MNQRLRIVTELPLAELWNDTGPVEALQLAGVGEDGVRTQLRLGAQGVVASIGKPLRWLRGAELFEWWKSEAHPRLAAPEVDSFRLENFPNSGRKCAPAATGARCAISPDETVGIRRRSRSRPPIDTASGRRAPQSPTSRGGRARQPGRTLVTRLRPGVGGLLDRATARANLSP
jgi:hypothetical protein